MSIQKTEVLKNPTTGIEEKTDAYYELNEVLIENENIILRGKKYWSNDAKINGANSIGIFALKIRKQIVCTIIDGNGNQSASVYDNPRYISYINEKNIDNRIAMAEQDHIKNICVDFYSKIKIYNIDFLCKDKKTDKVYKSLIDTNASKNFSDDTKWQEVPENNLVDLFSDISII